MAAGSSLQKMKVTHVLPSGDFAVANIRTACRLAGFVTASNRWSSQAVAALSELIVNQPLKGQLNVCFLIHTFLQCCIRKLLQGRGKVKVSRNKRGKRSWMQMKV